MEDTMKIILKYALLILSHSPIICLSDDSNFGTNEKGVEGFKTRIRISIFSFYFGVYRYYFITYKKGEGIKLKHKLDFNSHYTFGDSEQTRVTTNQKNYLSNATEFAIDKEFILYLIQNETNRKNKAYNKINTYTTIILAIIPLIILLFKPEIFIDAKLLVKILIILLLYTLINIGLFILQSNKVGANSRSTYAKLKSSKGKEQEIIASYYFDWQHLKRESDKIVGFVKNIEGYIKAAIFVTGLIVVLNFIINNRANYESNINIESVIQIDIDKLMDKESKTIERINIIDKKIKSEDVGKIIILYSNEKILDNKTFNSICAYYNIYKDSKDILKIKDEGIDGANKFNIIVVED